MCRIQLPINGTERTDQCRGLETSPGNPTVYRATDEVVKPAPWSKLPQSGRTINMSRDGASSAAVSLSSLTTSSPLCSPQRLYVSVHWQWLSMKTLEIRSRILATCGNFLDMADFVDSNCKCPKFLPPVVAQAFMSSLLVPPAPLSSPGVSSKGRFKAMSHFDVHLLLNFSDGKGIARVPRSP